MEDWKKRIRINGTNSDYRFFADEGVVDSVERNSKTTERELTVEMRTLRKETEVAIRETNANVDKKIQRALDNPLAK